MAVGVTDGSWRDPLLQADSSNAIYGLPRAYTDKRKAVGALLADPDSAQWSDREIARRCAVSHNFVSQQRRSLSSDDSEKPAERTYKTKHGTKSTMKVPAEAKTAVAKPAAAPVLSPEPVKLAQCLAGQKSAEEHVSRPLSSSVSLSSSVRLRQGRPVIWKHVEMAHHLTRSPTLPTASPPAAARFPLPPPGGRAGTCSAAAASAP